MRVAVFGNRRRRAGCSAVAGCNREDRRQVPWEMTMNSTNPCRLEKKSKCPVALALALMLLGATRVLGAEASAAESSGASPKVVIPFDFESKWDNGRYGQMVGEMIWKKLSKEKGVLTTESVLDIRDLCAEKQVRITPDTPLEQVRHVVRDVFDAQVGIWGSIERAPGTEGEIYDLVIKCYDFSGAQPRCIYEKQARTNSVSEVPHLYVKEMLDRLCERRRGPRQVSALRPKSDGRTGPIWSWAATSKRGAEAYRWGGSRVAANSANRWATSSSGFPRWATPPTTSFG